MYRNVFANRWSALLFVLVIAAGAASLVGTEDDKGVLDLASEQFADQQDDFGQQVETLAEPVHSETVIAAPQQDFFSDEELIDDAEGFDPSAEESGPRPPEYVDPQISPSDRGEFDSARDVTDDGEI